MTSLLKNSRRPDVSFYPDGRIDITSRIAKQLSLGEGDVIDVAIHKGEYLLYVRHKKENIVGAYEATVHATKKYKTAAYNMRAYSLKLTNALFCETGRENTEPLRLPAGSPVNIEGIGIAIPLITRNPL